MSKALKQEYKLNDIVALTDFFTPQQRSDFKSRSTVADLTTAVQAACDGIAEEGGGYELEAPDGVAALTAPITISAAMGLSGRGASPYVGSPLGNRGFGTWFYLNHTGKGFVVDGPSFLSGVFFKKFGTFRSQPAPGAAWTPNAHDFDFYLDNSDVLFDRMVLWNPTKAINLVNGEAGRIVMSHVRGQPLQVGLQIDKALDSVVLEDVRWWPFWQNDTNVHAYTLQNLDAFWFKRADNPMLTDVFSIFARAHLRFSETADGRTVKLRAVNNDGDRCKYGLWVDNTVTSGITAQLANFTAQGETGLAGTRGIFIEGNNSVIQMPDFDLREWGLEAIKVSGSTNQIRVGDMTIEDYNLDGTGVAAIDLASSNELYFGNPPRIGSAIWFSGAGNFNGLLKVEETNGTTDGVGEITVAHNLGITPSRVEAMVIGTGVYAHAQCGSFTSTTFKTKFFDAAGAALTGASLGFLWKAWA